MNAKLRDYFRGWRCYPLANAQDLASDENSAAFTVGKQVSQLSLAVAGKGSRSSLDDKLTVKRLN